MAKLPDAGCIRADWSWGSTDPATLQTLDDNAQRIHKKSTPEYEDIDNNSIRFVFPPESVSIMNEPIALVPPSFVGLGPPRTAALGSREPAQTTPQEDKPQEDNPQEDKSQEEGSKKLYLKKTSIKTPQHSQSLRRFQNRNHIRTQRSYCQ
ncbi:hypothetical protein V8C34DRAFT_304746 [Trichoderma compactum]